MKDWNVIFKTLIYEFGLSIFGLTGTHLYLHFEARNKHSSFLLHLLCLPLLEKICCFPWSINCMHVYFLSRQKDKISNILPHKGSNVEFRSFGRSQNSQGVTTVHVLPAERTGHALAQIAQGPIMKHYSKIVTIFPEAHPELFVRRAIFHLFSHRTLNPQCFCLSWKMHDCATSQL